VVVRRKRRGAGGLGRPHERAHPPPPPPRRPGASRLNATATVASLPGNGTRPLVAALHTVPCASAAARGGAPAGATYGRDAAYRRVTGDTGAGAAGAMVAATLTAPATTAATPPPASVGGGADAPFLVDYDEAVSVVAYDGSTPIACCQLAPPAPVLPDEWGATVEANIVEKGYTLALRQVYSAPLARVRTEVHAGGADRVVFQDLAAGTVTLVDAPNATHPAGACLVRPAAPGEGGVLGLTGGGGRDGALLSTAAALRFDPGEVVHAPLARALARGVPAETWTRAINDGGNASYTASYLFPVNAWIAGGARWGRGQGGSALASDAAVADRAPLLRRVLPPHAARRHRQRHAARGRPGDGRAGPERGPGRWGAGRGGRTAETLSRSPTPLPQPAVYHEYHFVNMRPRPGLAAGPGSVFDPCTVAPRGVGCGCAPGGSGGGTDADAVPYAGGGGGRAPGAPARAAGAPPLAARAEPRGFVPAQAGPYALVGILSALGGGLLAVGVPAAARAVGRTRARTFEPFQGGSAPAVPTVHAMSVASA